MTLDQIKTDRFIHYTIYVNAVGVMMMSLDGPYDEFQPIE